MWAKLYFEENYLQNQFPAYSLIHNDNYRLLISNLAAVAHRCDEKEFRENLKKNPCE